jgi:hypothetical protein
MTADQRAEAEYEQKRENGDDDSKSNQHGVPHSALLRRIAARRECRTLGISGG